MRIVSLVPSLTHMAAELGLADRIVGCTAFCVEPPGLAKRVGSVGGTKDPDLAKVAALAPTHVLVNEEENKPEHIATLAARVPTLVTFPKGPADVPQMLRDAGRFLGVPEAAETYALAVETELRTLASGGARSPQEKTGSPHFLYYIWREPYMVAGPDTYISRMLELTGARNAMTCSDPRYPELSVGAARALAPDLIYLSSEPYPFRKRDAARLREEWPGSPPIAKIDGQALSWYGTMTASALRGLREGSLVSSLC